MHILPSLPYAYDALEPYLDEQTMRLHHDKHHQVYVDKLNAVLEKFPELQNKKLEDLLGDLETVPESIRTTVRNHGGGHWNHTFFWNILAPVNSQGSTLGGKGQTLKLALEKNFGSVGEFEKQFKNAALACFGSGWTWLVKKPDATLAIMNTSNQDTPISMRQTPILGLDIWEHAYYLEYQNRRAEYIDAFFNVINWPQVEAHLTNNK